MSADVELTMDGLYQNSKLWPAYVILEETVPLEAGELRQGARAVLIRLDRKESELVAMLDFGRQGIHMIPIESTNLFAGAKELESGIVA